MWAVLPAVVGALAGGAVVLAWGVIRGYIPVTFGPEKKGWSRDDWAARPDAAAALAALADTHAEQVRKPSSRNFLQVTASTPERRVSQKMFWSEAEQSLTSIVHFGADCEGPPRFVHGGCSAAVADSVMGRCSYMATSTFAVTAKLQVNYRNGLPLGTTARLEARLRSRAGRKITTEFTLRSLDSAEGGEPITYLDGSALFIDTGRQGPKSGDAAAAKRE